MRTGVAPAAAEVGFACRRFVADGVDDDGDIEGEGAELEVDVDRDVDVDPPPVRDAPPSRAPAGNDALDTPLLPSDSVPWPDVGACDALEVDVRGGDASEVFEGRPAPDVEEPDEPDEPAPDEPDEPAPDEPGMNADDMPDDGVAP